MSPGPGRCRIDPRGVAAYLAFDTMEYLFPLNHFGRDRITARYLDVVELPPHMPTMGLQRSSGLSIWVESMAFLSSVSSVISGKRIGDVLDHGGCNSCNSEIIGWISARLMTAQGTIIIAGSAFSVTKFESYHWR